MKNSTEYYCSIPASNMRIQTVENAIENQINIITDKITKSREMSMVIVDVQSKKKIKKNIFENHCLYYYY